MEQKRLNHLEQISPLDWGKTPTSVKKLVMEMAQYIEEQEKKLVPQGGIQNSKFKIQNEYSISVSFICNGWFIYAVLY